MISSISVKSVKALGNLSSYEIANIIQNKEGYRRSLGINANSMLHFSTFYNYEKEETSISR